MNTQENHPTTLSDALPKWLQISTAIESEIDKRVETGNLRLPTEAELCEIYSVSLVTIRQALGALEKRGLISRKRKRGTYIVPDGIIKRTAVSIGKLSDFLDPNLTERADLIFAEVVPVPPSLADRFGGQLNVMKLIQRRYIDNDPSSYLICHVRLDVAAQTDLTRLQGCSIWSLFAQLPDVEIGHIDQTIAAKTAWPEVSENLGVELLAPVMVRVIECFDNAGDLLSIGTQVFRGDKYEFQLSVDAA